MVSSGPPCDVWKRRIASVLGKKVNDELRDFQVALLDYGEAKIEGFISKSVDSGSTDKQAWLKKNITYVFINSRPIDTPAKLCTLFQESYKQ